MKFKDLREFVTFLEGKGELRRIKTPVNSELEITEIADRVVKMGGPALMFENVTGYDMPVLINMFGTGQRMAWGLGVDNLDDLVERVEGLLQLMHGPPQGLINKLRALGQLAHLGSFQPKTVNNAPCQEIVLQGEEVDLFQLPVLKCWPMDAGRFITLPLVITKALALNGASWGSSDTIIYSEFGAGLAQVAATGGDPTFLTVPDVERGEQAHVWPQILPGEKHVLFTVYTQVDARAAILSLETRDWQPLPLPQITRYLPTGHLIYSQMDELWGVRFDLQQLSILGTPFRIGEQVPGSAHRMVSPLIRGVLCQLAL